MTKLLPLAALLTVTAVLPAHAQEGQVYYASDAWPVHTSGGTCTMVQAVPDAGSVLSVSYDGDILTLTSTNELESPLPATGKVDLGIVFLNNGDTDYDPGWGARQFSYARTDGVYRFTARFSGERNVRQLLADLSNSEWIGLLQRGEAVVSYQLAGMDTSLTRLRECGARRVASN